MLQLINKLIELADRIGNGASVSVLAITDNGKHSIRIRVDWFDVDFHVMSSSDYAYIAKNETAFFNRLVHAAHVAYERRTKK